MLDSWLKLRILRQCPRNKKLGTVTLGTTGSATIHGVGPGENVQVSGLEARGTPPQDGPHVRPGNRGVLAEAWF